MLVTDLVAMLRDPEWRLPDSMRARARIVLSSFVDPDEPVSDDVPGLEFLDDAAVIEIAGAELQHELASYRKYRRYRETVAKGLADSEARPALQECLVAKRRQLRARIQDKRPRVEESARFSGRLLTRRNGSGPPRFSTSRIPRMIRV